MADPAPLPDALVSGHRRWHADDRAGHGELYARLAREGQEPATMVIQCSDSRVDAVALFGAAPGELFVVRNVANLVPPADAGDGIAAALDYAVGPLGVSHLVVLGHSGCGGVAACAELCAAGESGDGAIPRWVGHLRPAWERADDDLPALGRAGVLVSLENLLSYPAVAAAVDSGAVSLHGAWIDIASGALHIAGPGGEFSAL